MRNDIRRYTSMKSNAQGHIFEQSIERACTIYRDRNIAHIIKVPEPFRVMKKLQNGIFQGRFTARAEPDFQGTLSSGQSIVFEAKHTMQDKMLQSVLTDVQIHSLLTHESLGAKAGVCISIQDEFFFIPIRIWANMKELYGRKYIRADDIQEYKVKFNGAVMFLDYI
nr:MAG TPA: recombination protein [Caudoviricetes sp.]